MPFTLIRRIPKSLKFIPKSSAIIGKIISSLSPSIKTTHSSLNKFVFLWPNIVYMILSCFDSSIFFTFDMPSFLINK